jgi:hypothetical protein
MALRADHVRSHRPDSASHSATRTRHGAPNPNAAVHTSSPSTNVTNHAAITEAHAAKATSGPIKPQRRPKPTRFSEELMSSVSTAFCLA